MEDAISGITRSNLSSQVSMAVLRKAMDAQEQEGAAMIKMIRELMPRGDGERPGAGELDLYA